MATRVSCCCWAYFWRTRPNLSPRRRSMTTEPWGWLFTTLLWVQEKVSWCYCSLPVALPPLQDLSCTMNPFQSGRHDSYHIIAGILAGEHRRGLITADASLIISPGVYIFLAFAEAIFLLIWKQIRRLTSVSGHFSCAAFKSCTLSGILFALHKS